MADIVELLTEQAASSAQTAEQATERAAMGNQAVAQTVAAMTRIRDNTQETARRIKRLGESTQEISEAVRFIEELADRTTVLALNASIQAAAAGEAGRGFAVVAEEVQRLAERAAGATRQIEELVKNIQAETNEAVVGIEDATREVVEGSQLAQEAGDRMAELNELVSRLAALIEHVAETTASQTGESMSALTELSVGLWESVAGFGTRDGDGDGHTN
jgi:twitching motility protein PilJ